MAETTPEEADIPRYLRYRAEERHADWDDHLERANRILHERVQRMHRDKLCTGCAKFDWKRAQFYARDVENEDQYYYRYTTIRGVEDNVSWQELEVFLVESEELKLLADHPRFEWQLRKTDHQCALCDTLATLFYREKSSLTAIRFLREIMYLKDSDDSHEYAPIDVELKLASSHEPICRHQCSGVSPLAISAMFHGMLP